VPDEKLPPHDIDAEEAVLGSLLIDGTAIYKIDGSLRRENRDFYREQNRLIYEACLDLYHRNEAINQITVAQELARQNKLDECGGAAYLSHLIANCPTSLDIEHYAQIVYRLGVMRRLINASEQIKGIGYQAEPDVDRSLDRAEDILYSLRHKHVSRDFVPIRQLLDSYFETAAPELDEERAGVIRHLYSGFAGLDEFLGGFQRSDFMVLAGRPSMGKTSLALSIARNAAVNQNACVAMFSLEMSKESLVLRLLASEAEVDLRRVRFGYQTDEEEKRVMDSIGILSEASLYIDDSPQLRIAEMRSKSRRLHNERNIDLIVVDHLGLMQADTKMENRVQEVSYISRSLKALARELEVPLVAVSQLSRASEWRATHKPQLSDLRDSGSIEQDADVVLFIYRDEYYYRPDEWAQQHPDQNYPEGVADIIIAKQRNGPTGEVKLRFRRNLTKFENIAEEPSVL
jgi:replicative DNA helicase